VRTLAADTTPEAERVLIELLRAASPEKKIRMMLDANRTARTLAIAGLKERHPGESAVQLRRRLADLWLGPELALKAYGPMPTMDEGTTELLAAVVRVAKAFEALGVDYLIGGSIASTLFGEPRQTVDADLIARLIGRQAEPFVKMLTPEFYTDLPSINSAILNQGSFNLIHLNSMAKVDVFVRWRSPFAQSQFARRQKKAIGESNPVELFFASPEDTVLAKLEWYRDGGSVSDRQWRDILGVLKVQSNALDAEYLKHWARELGVAELLSRAVEEVGGK
jgi:hypothetical protein